jgi:Subtilase family
VIPAVPRVSAVPVSLVVKLPPESDKRRLRVDVRSSLGTGWTARRLFETDVDKPELMRWYVVTGALPVAAPLTDVQAAWESAHRLQRLGEYEIEPQVPKGAYAPTRIGIRSGGEAPHLPGSADKSWALKKIRAPEAWALPVPTGGRRYGAGIVVGHPDTGYTRHREIYPSALDLQLDRDIVASYDDATDPMQEGTVGHGTATGSVIASRLGLDIKGTAPSTKLRPIRTILDVVVIFGGNVARAIDYARRTRCDVISMSLGGLFLGGVRDAVDAAVQDGCIVLAAAGNVWPTVVEPANYPNCIAVAATNAQDAKWKDSSSGSQVAVSAPGESVWVAHWEGGQQGTHRSSGTSFAVAHVAGVAALWLAFHGPGTLRAKYGARTSAAFRRLLTATARKPAGWDTGAMGAGIVDARALLTGSLPADADVRAPARAAAPRGPSGRDVLRDIAPSTLRTTRRAVERPAGPARRARRRVVPSAEEELYYRELVYLATERPALVATERSRSRQTRSLTPTLVRSFASPSLAERLAPTDA